MVAIGGRYFSSLLVAIGAVAEVGGYLMGSGKQALLNRGDTNRHLAIFLTNCREGGQALASVVEYWRANVHYAGDVRTRFSQIAALGDGAQEVRNATPMRQLALGFCSF